MMWAVVVLITILLAVLYVIADSLDAMERKRHQEEVDEWYARVYNEKGPKLDHEITNFGEIRQKIKSLFVKKERG